MSSRLIRAGLGLLAGASSLSTLAKADEFPWGTERRIIGTSELEPIENAIGTPLYNYARVIARLEDTDGIGFCTSVRVGQDLFLTNYHCYDYKPCDSIQFHLAFEKAVLIQNQLILKCKEVLAKNMTYDYALYRVEGIGTVPKSVSEGLDLTGDTVAPSLDSFPVATLWTGPIKVDEPLFLAGHPGARFKEMDRGAKCKLRTIVPEMVEERQTITHTCDTEGGSSGSPVMDHATGYVIALHWGGKDDYNMAIPVTEIVPDMQKSLKPETFAELHILNQ